MIKELQIKNLEFQQVKEKDLPCVALNTKNEIVLLIRVLKDPVAIYLDGQFDHAPILSEYKTGPRLQFKVENNS